MPRTQNATNAMPASDLASVEAALADLDLGGEEIVADPEVELEAISEIVEEVLEESAEEEVVEEEAAGEPEVEAEAEVAAASPAVNDDILADLDIAITRTEAYAEQESKAEVNDVSEELAKKPAKKPKHASGKKASASVSGGTSAARTPRDISTVADEFFVLSGDPSTMDAAALTAAKADTLALIPKQVKVAEKFENLFTAVSVGNRPSRYTMLAFDLLDAKGTIASTDIVNAYKSAGLGEGTARSQSGQMMNLFAALKIADRTGQTLKLRDDSLLAERLRKLPKPAAAA